MSNVFHTMDYVSNKATSIYSHCCPLHSQSGSATNKMSFNEVTRQHNHMRSLEFQSRN